MRLYQETRIQAFMLLSIGILFTASLAFMAAGLTQNSLAYLLTSGGLLITVAPIIMIGQRRSQTVLDRLVKIREGRGDEADLEWLKTRNEQ